MQIPDSTLKVAMNFAINSLEGDCIDSLFLCQPVAKTLAASLSKINFDKSINVIQSELHDEIDNMLKNNNSEAAIFFTVMSYSLTFWDEAKTNTSNPWYSFVNKYTFCNKANMSSKGFLRDAYNKLKGWWNEHIRHDQTQEVPRVVEIALYDAAGAVTGAPLASTTGFTSVIFGAVVYSGLAIIFT